MSKLLGNGRIGNAENDQANARNATNKNTKKKSGRPKYRVELPGRRRKKNRNTHRKTSLQRPSPRGKKRRDRLKGDRKSQPKVPGCEKKGECPPDKTQNKTDVKRNKTSSSFRTRDKQPEIEGSMQAKTGLEKGFKSTNILTESSLDKGHSDKFNLTTQTSLVHFGTDRNNRQNKTSNEKHEREDNLQQTENQCPGDRDESQKNVSKTIGSHGQNSSRSEPCTVVIYNGSAPNVSCDRKLERTKPVTRLNNRENGNAVTKDEVDVDKDNDDARDNDYEYTDEEEGWKSNMETVFAEFDREKAEEHRDTLRQVKWNQSKGKLFF